MRGGVREDREGEKEGRMEGKGIRRGRSKQWSEKKERRGKGREGEKT